MRGYKPINNISDKPEQSFHQPSNKKTLPFAVLVTVICIGLGIGLSFVLFGRDENNGENGNPNTSSNTDNIILQKIRQDKLDIQEVQVDVDFTSPDLAFKELKGHVKCMYIQEFGVKEENGEYVVSGIREYLDGFESKKLRDDFSEEGNLIGNIQEYRWPADMDCWSKAKWTELNPSMSFTAQIKEVLHGYTSEHNHTIILTRDENGFVKKLVYDCDSEDDYEKFYSCTPTTFEYFWEDGRIKKITEGSDTYIYVYDSDGYLKSKDVESYGEENTMTRTCMYYSKYKYDDYGNWIERLVTVEGQYGDAGDEDDTRYAQLESSTTERYIEKREIIYY